MNRQTIWIGALCAISLTLSTKAIANGELDKSATSEDTFWADPNSATGCGAGGWPCTPTVNTEIKVESNLTGTEWIVSGWITSAHAIDASNDTVIATRSGANYTFMAGSSVSIAATDYPGVPAMTINMSGITTDNTGHYVFHILR